jgi:beta-glucosidase
LRIDKRKLRVGETADISFTLKNTGNFDSDEVAQLYVSFPDSKVERPEKALKGFRRALVPRGGTVEVTIPLKADDLQYWYTDKQQWVLKTGKVKVFIGVSSDDMKLEEEIKVD